MGGLKRQLAEVVEPRGRSALADGLRMRAWNARSTIKALRMPETGLPLGDKDVTSPGVPRRGGSFYRDHLLGNVVPFWARHAIDREHGGYLTHLDRYGRLFAANRKYTAMQARLVYAFSLAHEVDPRPEYLALAGHGARFMRERLWDPRHGGWCYSATREGEVCNGEKWSVTQAYAAIGLIAHQRASGDADSRASAEETLRLLDRHLWDRSNGGYYEGAGRDWKVRSRLKTACVHNDMLTALLSAGEGGLSSRYVSRRDELAGILPGGLRIGSPPRLAEKCQADWTYSAMSTRDTLDVGHGLKAAALLARTYEQTGCDEYLAHARRLADFYLGAAWDPRHGGLFTHLFRTSRPASDEKLWWTQAEGIVALAALWHHTRNGGYRRLLDRITDFCIAHFIDPAGEWYTSCGPDGTIRDPRKGNTWKGPYHSARAGFYGWRYLSDGAPSEWRSREPTTQAGPRDLQLKLRPARPRRRR